MKIHFKIFVFLLILSISLCKFENKSAYTFKVNPSVSNPYLSIWTSFLSPDDKQLMVISKDIITGKYHQQVFDFKGNKLCEINLDENIIPQQWPLGTNGLYFDNNIVNSTSIYKANSLCSIPQVLFTENKTIRRFQIRNTTNATIMGFLVDYHMFRQYDLLTGNLLKQFSLPSNQFAYLISYSQGGNYLFIDTVNQSTINVIIFDTDNYQQRQREIKTKQFSLIVGLSDGKGYIGNTGTNYKQLYFIDQNGNSTKLFKIVTSPDQYDLTYCGDLIVTGLQNDIDKLLIINPTNRTLDQRIVLDFGININRTQVSCNQKYLSIIDDFGYAHVFKIEGLAPDPQDNDDDSFPVWAIVLIVIASLLIIGGGVLFMIQRHKQNKSEYKRFSNNKSMDYVD